MNGQTVTLCTILEKQVRALVTAFLVRLLAPRALFHLAGGVAKCILTLASTVNWFQTSSVL